MMMAGDDERSGFQDVSERHHGRVGIGPEWSNTDTTLSVEALAFNATVDYKAAFPVPVLASVTNIRTRVFRRGKRFVGEIRYEGRVDIINRAIFLLGIDPFFVGKSLLVKRPLIARPGAPPGTVQVIRLSFARSAVKRKCKEYRYCKLGVGVTQSHPYVDEQGHQRYMQIVPDHANGSAGRVVKDTRRLCRKLRERKKQHTRLYRKRCPIPPANKTRTAADIKKQKEKKEREEEKNRP
ncbi:MAG: hypothetical protein WD404_05140 [Solirubrobacterales bacterium]